MWSINVLRNSDDIGIFEVGNRPRLSYLKAERRSQGSVSVNEDVILSKAALSFAKLEEVIEIHN